MYVEDCQAAFGKLFGHDDSINDRAPGLQLENGFQRTARLYAETFGRPYTFAGGMWRGPAPASNMVPAPLRAQDAGTGPDMLSAQGQGNPECPSAAVLHDSTNASRAVGQALPLLRAGASAKQQPVARHSPSEDMQCTSAAVQNGSQPHGQDTGNRVRSSKNGVMQSLRRLWRGSQDGSSQKASKQVAKGRKQHADGCIAHEFRVVPAAAKEASGDAMGRADGHIILPCYEADRSLPGGLDVEHIAVMQISESRDLPCPRVALIFCASQQKGGQKGYILLKLI